jgi:hypothetical protein
MPDRNLTMANALILTLKFAKSAYMSPKTFSCSKSILISKGHYSMLTSNLLKKLQNCLAKKVINKNVG